MAGWQIGDTHPGTTSGASTPIETSSPSTTGAASNSKYEETLWSSEARINKSTSNGLNILG